MLCGSNAEMKPTRVQLSRKRGWRMPPDTIKIDRSTQWGNPFKVGEAATHPASLESIEVRSKEAAIELFELYLKTAGSHVAVAARRELKGKNLACWCQAGQRCHGDVLLKVANTGSGVQQVA